MRPLPTFERLMEDTQTGHKRKPAGPKQAADPDNPEAARIRQEMADQLVQDDEQDKQQKMMKKKQQGRKKKPQSSHEAEDH